MMNIHHELEKRVNVFNKELKRYLTENTPRTLYEAAQHLPMSGGKRLRPCLSMLACESVSGESSQVMPFAVALELVHNFTLVHDDIMDHSHLRRNVQTVHTRYGEPTAILAGDLLFAKAFEAVHNLRTDLSVFKEAEYLLVRCVEDICEGQQLDMEFEQRKIVSEEEYLDMIRRKTSVLFQCAAQGGAIIGKGSEREIRALSDFGLFVGLAFQIWDDYLDLSSNEEILGKDVGNDIRNGKKTLIAVHALLHTKGKEKTMLDEIFGNKDAQEEDIKKILTMFRMSKSIDYAKQTAVNYCKKAENALAVLQDSEAKTVLKELAAYSIQREK